jgi:hypothetical protein
LLFTLEFECWGTGVADLLELGLGAADDLVDPTDRAGDTCRPPVLLTLLSPRCLLRDGSFPDEGSPLTACCAKDAKLDDIADDAADDCSRLAGLSDPPGPPSPERPGIPEKPGSPSGL